MAPFFFSYAHNDALDQHLEDFFDEVNKRVRFYTGTKVDGFRDKLDLRAGEEWSKELAAELAMTPALVCLYSPSYFQSKVCAQELQVFLERRRKYLDENPGKRPSNIIPVLWQPCDIPVALPGFEYEKPRARELEKDGVWEVRARKKLQEFQAIAKSVAVRVKDAQKAPLPDFAPVPVLGGVQSAFDPPPLPPAEFDTTNAGGPQCATFIYPATLQWKQWPFVPKHDPLLHISAAVAKGRDLIPYQFTFDPAVGLFPRLNTAREKNHLLVLLLCGSQLNDPALVTRLRDFDREGLDTVSTLIAWPPGTKTAAAQNVIGQAFPRLSQRTPPNFYADLDQPDKFAAAVAESLDYLKMAVLKNPSVVHELSVASEFMSLPSVAGPGRRQAA
jgi:hypothetical protein